MKTRTTHFMAALALLALATLNPQLTTARAQGTAFTYQGTLADGGSPATGSYDLIFALFDAVTHGTQQGVTVTNAATPVTNGQFTVTLDFGSAALDLQSGRVPKGGTPGRWLELAVSSNGANTFVTLAPRQLITPVPYAIFANTASNLSGTVAADRISGQLQPAQLPATVVFNGQPAVNLGGSFNGGFSGAFNGNGAGLNNLNASQLTTGTVPLAQLPSSVVLNGASGVTLSGAFSGDGSGLSNVTATVQLPSYVVTNGATGVTLAGTFNGDGGGLTNVNAAQLNGTLPDAVLSTNVTLLNGTNLFGGTNTFAGVLIATNSANQISGSFAGSGAGLTGLSATQLTGIVPLTQLPANLVTNGASGVTFSGAFCGDGSGLSNVTATVQLPANVVTNGATGLTLSGTFSGSGGGLTNLNAAQLNGTVPDTGLSSNVALLNGTNLFGGTNTFAGVLIATNPANQISGSFAGSGAGLTGLSTAQLTGTVPLAQLPANLVTNGAGGINLSGTFSGDGSGLTNLNGGNLGAGTVGSAQLVPGAQPSPLVAAGTNVNAQANTLYDATNSSQTTFVPPLNANVGDVIQINGMGAGGWSVTSPPGAVWTLTTNGQNWVSVASSTNGTRLVAVAQGGPIYTSTDSGVTWTAQASPSTNWQSVASSYDGTKLVAVVKGGQIYTSVNSGTNWTIRFGAPSTNWQSVASSADGTFLVAAVKGGQIYTSPNSGGTWTTLNAPSTNWQSVVVSRDGLNKIFAVVNGGHMYSSFAGITGTLGNVPSTNWQSIASSFNCNRLVAVVNGGQIYTSANTGNTWTALTNAPSTNWQAVASSPDGKYLEAVVNGGQVYTSTDGGTNWTAQPGAPSTSWQSVASSYDGTKLVAAGGSGLYISSSFVFGTGAQGSSGQFNYLGNGIWQQLSPAYNGSTFTDLNASALTSGTVSDTRLSTNVAFRVGGNTFRGVQNFTGGSSTTMNFDNGYYLTAANSSGGYEAFLYPRWLDDRTILNFGNNGFDIRNNVSTVVMNLASNGTVTIAGTNTAGFFTGNGVGLTGLSASQLTTGTVPLARLPSSVVLNGASGVTLAGAFSGDGGGLTNLNGAALSTNVAMLNINNTFTGASNTFNGTVKAAAISSGNLVVNGSQSATIGANRYLDSGGVAVGGGGTISCSVYASGNVAAAVYFAFSDARIKRIAGRSDSTSDLQTLLGIQVTDYTYVDTVAKGDQPQKKVIAQQVEQVYPQAVSRTTDVVPDIYQKAAIREGWVQLATDLKAGERVKLIGENEEGIYPVLEVRGGAFRTDFAPTDGKVFVYGREVKDFRTVDYEAIAMLNVSATQELKKEKDAEITELKRRLDKLELLLNQKSGDTK